MKKIALLFAMALSFSVHAETMPEQDLSYEDAMAAIDWDCRLSDDSYAGAIWNDKESSFTYRYIWEGQLICESKDNDDQCAAPVVAKTPWGYSKGEMVDNAVNNIHRICRGDRALLPAAYKNLYELK